MKASLGWLCLGVLFGVFAAGNAFAFKDKDPVVVHAYVNDACIIADEPFFLPVAAPKDGEVAETPKFLPLIGLVVGKLAELFINHEIQSSANRYKAGYARKDTRYAMSSQMNLYRADFDPAPSLNINARLGCMTIVAGNFKAETVDCTAAYIPKQLSPDSVGKPQDEWKTSRTDDSIENQLRRANICIEGKASAVYEARFEFSKDGTAYRLKDAGYRIDALLTTDKAGATRTGLYTLKISNPAATDQQEVLSSAWVNIGTVKAGARSAGKNDDSAPWLKVPPLSVEARRNYEQQTKIQQDTTAEIQALERSQVRNQRMLAGLDQRIESAPADLKDGLKQERTRVAVQNQSQGAELDARKAEYQDLPRKPLEFMPVSIEVAVTETESEKKAQVALAEMVGTNSDLVASAVGNAATGILSKSLKPEDLNQGGADDLETARARYYDALVDARSPAPGNAARQAQLKLAAARDNYNVARESLGLERIP
ncbi:MAG TPA: hypothetical protein VGI93_12970 [Steroidobacteraceae bacterium]|jgi:hypothetical protein